MLIIKWGNRWTGVLKNCGERRQEVSQTVKALQKIGSESLIAISI